MGVSWVALTELLRRHVWSEFETELDHHATELAAILRIDADGRPLITQPLSDHRFGTIGSGHYWQVEARNGDRLRSGSLGDATLPLELDFAAAGRDRADTVSGPAGPVLIAERTFAVGDPVRVLRVAVAIETGEIDVVMQGLRRIIGVALAVIAAGLIAAVLAQVTFGLRPLGRVRSALGAIRRGEASRLPDDLPLEVAPLARSMNDLIAANEDVIRRARVQAGNLAHALKTPLAILMDEARRVENTGHFGEVVLRESERMRRQIEYQLAHARAAASSGSVTAAAPIGPAIQAIISAMSRLYAHRSLRFELDGSARDLVAACEKEDLDELLGNILDNAAKWAGSRIRVRVSTVERPSREMVLIVVEDDGPGMPDDARERVFQVGQRLDEQVPGTGLGLAIVRDVAGLYSGRCWIERSDLGGVAFHLELPLVGAV